MLTVYGMSTQMPNRSLVEKGRNPFLDQGPATQRRSEKLEALLDREAQDIINAAYQEARQVLADHRAELEAMARLLLEKEKIDAQDIQGVLGPAAVSQEPEANGNGSATLNVA
jgi:cell division protease FtsH